MAMLTETEAQIYLADQRGRTQTADFRSFHTFNVPTYQAEGRQPFGVLTVFNDDTLLAGKTHSITVDEPTDMLLLPVIGGIELVDGLGENVFLDAGEVFEFTAYPAQEYRVLNPYDVEAINYLQIGLKANTADSESPEHFPIMAFDLSKRNQLLPLLASANQNRLGFIGQYDGRQEGLYSLSDSQNRIFVFIIEGAFEVQNRLLHPRDGLALWNTDVVEFEALSNNAILMILEL